MKFKVFPFEQPAGQFLLGVMSGAEVIRISTADPRKFDSVTMETHGGIQREPSKRRVADIADYARTVDASFPTPILLALPSGTYRVEDNTIEIIGDGVADIVDGQHRVLGLKESGVAEQFVVPVVFVLDATEEQKALIFATINGKQTKVPASLVYDLFGVTEARSPQKTAHEIARALNLMSDSPWHRRLKMLGRKTSGSNESLSQGTFVNFLIPLITRTPDDDRNRLKAGKEPIRHTDCVFNYYFLKSQDSMILKVLLNAFGAAQTTWPVEWDDPTASILTKTTGFSAIMRALPKMIEMGKTKSDLSKDHFDTIFESTKARLRESNLSLTSRDFPPSAAGEALLAKFIAESHTPPQP